MDTSLRQLPDDTILVGRALVLRRSEHPLEEDALAQWQDGNGLTFYLQSTFTLEDLAVLQDFESLPLVAPIHNRGAAKCAWRIGDAFLKATHWVPGLRSEAENIRYVHENFPGIPAPEVVHGWVDEQMRRAFTITKAMPGETLEDVWTKLTDFQCQSIAAQVSLICDVLRSSKAPCLQSLSGGGVYAGDITPASMRSQEQRERWWEPELYGPATLELTRASLAPLAMEDEFVFMHGDLSACNIMVKDGSLSGIIDWQTAAELLCMFLSIKQYSSHTVSHK